MPFDPSQPFEVVGDERPAFDPSKPFEAVATLDAPEPASEPGQIRQKVLAGDITKEEGLSRLRDIQDVSPAIQKTTGDFLNDEIRNVGRVFSSELAKTGYTTAQGAVQELSPSSLVLSGKAENPAYQSHYDQLSQQLKDIQRKNAFSDAPDPREQDIFNQLRALDAGGGQAKQLADVFKEAAATSDIEHGVNPALNNTLPVQITKGAAGAASLAAEAAIPGIGFPAVVAQTTLASGAQASNAKEEELKAKGVTDQATIDAAKDKAKDDAEAWTLVTTPIYIASNAAVAKGLKAIVPGDWSALSKWATQFGGQFAGNQLTASALAAAKAAGEAPDGQRMKSATAALGESFGPESLAMNAAFALHGATAQHIETQKEALRAKADASDLAPQTAAVAKEIADNIPSLANEPTSTSVKEPVVNQPSTPTTSIEGITQPGGVTGGNENVGTTVPAEPAIREPGAFQPVASALTPEEQAAQNMGAFAEGTRPIEQPQPEIVQPANAQEPVAAVSGSVANEQPAGVGESGPNGRPGNVPSESLPSPVVSEPVAQSPENKGVPATPGGTGNEAVSGAEQAPVVGPALIGQDGNVLVQGKIGQSHADLIKEAIFNEVDPEAVTNATRAFTDTNGNVLSRAEASVRGKKNGQLPANAPSDVQSEDFTAYAKERPVEAPPVETPVVTPPAAEARTEAPAPIAEAAKKPVEPQATLPAEWTKEASQNFKTSVKNAFNLNNKQAEAVHAFFRAINLEPSRLTIERGEEPGINLKQNKQLGKGVIAGEAELRRDGTAIIRGFNAANVSTALHEIYHVAEFQVLQGKSQLAQLIRDYHGITKEDLATYNDWTGHSTAKTMQERALASEKGARAMERYLHDGVAPSGLEKLFAAIKKWMRDIYGAVKGTPIEQDVPPEVKAFFDKLLTAKEEKPVNDDNLKAEAVLSLQKQIESMAERNALDPAAVYSGVQDRVMKMSRRPNETDAKFKERIGGTAIGSAFTQASTDVYRENTAQKRDIRQTTSMDQPVGAEGDMTIGDTLAAHPEQFREALYSDLREHVSNLPDDQRTALSLMLQGHEPEEIADRMGKTLGETQAIIDGATEALKAKMGPGAANITERLAVYSKHKFGERVAKEFPPEVQNNIQRYYEQISNATTAEDTQKAMSGLNNEEAEALVRDTRNNLPNRVRTAAGMVVLKRLKDAALAVKASDPAEYQRLLDKQIDLFDWINEWGKDLGQGVQAFAMWDALGADGIYRKISRDIKAAEDRFKDKTKGKTKKLKEDVTTGDEEAIKGAVEGTSETKEKVAKTAVARDKKKKSIETQAKDVASRLAKMFPEKSEGNIWDRYQQEFADRLAKALKKGDAAPSPALQLFTNRLSKNILGFVPKEEQTGSPEKIQATIEDALNNREKYEQAFQKALDEVMSEGPQPQNITDFMQKLEASIKDLPVSPKTIASFVTQKSKDIDLSLSNAVTAWYKADRRTRGDIETIITDSLVKDLNIPEADAKRLAEEVAKGFREKAEAARLKAVERIANPKEKLTAEKKKKLAQLLEFANIGAITDEQAYAAIAEKMGLPVFDKDFAKSIYEDAQDIQDTPEGWGRTLKKMALARKVATQKGFAPSDFGASFAYVNMLSSPDTHMVNTLDSALNNFSAALSDVIASGGKDIARLEGMMKGYGKKGLIEARETLKTGHRISGGTLEELNPSNLEVAKFGQKGGVPMQTTNAASRALKAALEAPPAAFLNSAKYVGRALEAQDAFNFSASYEGQLYSDAAAIARGEGLSGKALRERVNEILNRGDGAYQKALEQAKQEGFEKSDAVFRALEIQDQNISQEMKDKAFQRGLFDAYRNKPKGYLGAVAMWMSSGINSIPVPIIRNAVRLGVSPFIVTPTNVFNRWLDYSPWGYKRAFFGSGNGTKNFRVEPYAKDSLEFRTQLVKASSGLLVTGAIGSLVAAGIMSIEGSGPANEDERRQWKSDGNKPYSIRMGNGPSISFQYTPWALPLTAMANYVNWTKYNKGEKSSALNRLAVAFTMTPAVFMDMPFFQGPSDFFSALGKMKQGQGLKAVTNFFGGKMGLVIPGIARWVDNLFDPRQVSDTDVSAILVDRTPIVRQLLGTKAYNLFGDVIGEDKPFLSRIFSRFYSVPKPSKESLILATFDAYPHLDDPGKAKTVNKQGEAVPMNQEQYEKFAVGVGRDLKQFVQKYDPNGSYSDQEKDNIKTAILNYYNSRKNQWRRNVAE